MEVVTERSAFLSNYEVLDMLKSIKENKKQKTRNQLATITYQTIRHLEDTPCKKQTPEIIKNFMTAIEPFKLTKCEKLTILNLCPKTAVELQLIIEDSEERINEEEIKALLDLVVTHLDDCENEEEPMEEGS
ncbi:hypothetical protein PV325_002990 [Microctonus aethiopoides]|uniref:DNA-directed RNA polymerase III subunit RPC9 n=1 Tax=Microctonus aethiopoides TaxID=144406 RepID=A0AA39F1M3_9HYME|nr:hypothetical protein PV325_002990 [Microctonus aethiopoides]KAK0087718.1 hypothetical protein PV326_005066 [Microctonus aethiopoides]KAK0160813.1 hypothetical protein PV328_008180 [Microctonus aethiopoides]